jgi:hypothetical protein
MSDEPAEQPDPVADALRMRASDADREKIAGILRDGYADGRLSHPEYDERLTAVYQAATYADLIPIVADLPVPPGTLAVPASNGVVLPVGTSTSSPAMRLGLPVSSDTSVVAIFSEANRAGAWTVPAEFSSTCVFGGSKLDFTEAILTSRETILTSVCIFGGLEIVIPEGMAVRNEAVGIFGGVEVPGTAVQPGAPLLVIKGAAIFGGIEVKYPKTSKKRKG